MAYLLGASAVIESLQRDVRDVQGCVSDVLSRIGPVLSTSWKFPDKTAVDLDIEDLLDLYSYSDDEEERQVAHIALYELVIDRLVLLIQTLAVFTDGTLKTAKADVSKEETPGTSVGVIVKKYWNRLSQLKQVVKQVVSEKNTMSRKVKEMEEDVDRLNTELKHSYNTSRPKTAGLGSLIPPNRAEMMTGMSFDGLKLKEFGLISKDEYNKSCQTKESAFSPCDSCSVVQRSFRQSGELVVGICQQQQIPSCLQKFRPQVSHLDWLNGNDVARWSTEQNKDLQRISKLTATMKPLKEELEECHKKNESLEKRVNTFDRDLKKERDERTGLHRHYELKMSEMKSQFSQTIELEKLQKDLLQQNKEELEKMIEKYRSELQEQKSLLKELENTKLNMLEELSSNKRDSTEVSRLESEKSSLQSRLEDILEKYDVSSKQIQKEQAKIRSISKHSESLQSKQQALLQRIENLDEENKELRDQLTELDEEREKAEDQYNDTKRTIIHTERKLKEKEVEIAHVIADKESLEQTVGTMERTVESLNDKLEEAKERERLIVEYPDLNGPVNPDITGSGDIILDMENQVKANNIRIQLLETQNDGLRNSILKLGSMQQSKPPAEQWATHVKNTKPQPLWKPVCVTNADETAERTIAGEYTEMDYRYYQPDITHTIGRMPAQQTKHQHLVPYQSAKPDSSTVKPNESTESRDKPLFGRRPQTGASSKKTTDDFVVGRAVRPNSGKAYHTKRNQPSSGKRILGSTHNTSIGAYMQLKKSGKLNMNTTAHSNSAGHSRPSTGNPQIPYGRDTESECSYVKRDQFSCQNCDKMYNKERDLEIHMSYCTG